MINYTDVLIALCGMIGVVATAYYGKSKVSEKEKQSKNLEHKNEQITREMDFQRASLSFEDFLTNWGHISAEIDKLMLETNVDRFLLLRAWNGILSPKWTTAFYQIRQGNQKPISYVHYELDDDYIHRLRHISKQNVLYFKVSDIPESGIKRIYQAEGVSYSLWIHLSTVGIDKTDSKSITYCSFATHSEQGFSEKTKLRCELIASRMKDFFK